MLKLINIVSCPIILGGMFLMAQGTIGFDPPFGITSHNQMVDAGVGLVMSLMGLVLFGILKEPASGD